MTSAADEAAHPPGAGAWWSDAWHLDAATSDGVGLTLHLECYPNQKTAWFWTYLVLPSLSGPVVVRDHEVPLPRQGLEVRAEGLWSELWCETPLEHWTYGLEAFAVALDTPDAALTGELGERVPIGLDLEWEVDGPVWAHRADRPVAGYAAPGMVHGDVLLGRERFALDAPGTYTRTWGERAWHATGAWSVSCAGPTFALYVDGTAAGEVDGSFRREPEGVRLIRTARREAHADMTRVVLDDEIEIELEVLMSTPVPIDTRVHLDRALCRMRVDDLVETGWSSMLAAR
ncbi:MAG: hypothetical protein ACRDV7_00625 [Acidimicrobiia bacterium]